MFHEGKGCGRAMIEKEKFEIEVNAELEFRKRVAVDVSADGDQRGNYRIQNMNRLNI